MNWLEDASAGRNQQPKRRSYANYVGELKSRTYANHVGELPLPITRSQCSKSQCCIRTDRHGRQILEITGNPLDVGMAAFHTLTTILGSSVKRSKNWTGVKARIHDMK